MPRRLLGVSVTRAIKRHGTGRLSWERLSSADCTVSHRRYWDVMSPQLVTCPLGPRAVPRDMSRGCCLPWPSRGSPSPRGPLPSRPAGHTATTSPLACLGIVTAHAAARRWGKSNSSRKMTAPSQNWALLVSHILTERHAAALPALGRAPPAVPVREGARDPPPPGQPRGPGQRPCCRRPPPGSPRPPAPPAPRSTRALVGPWSLPGPPDSVDPPGARMPPGPPDPLGTLRTPEIPSLPQTLPGPPCPCSPWNPSGSPAPPQPARPTALPSDRRAPGQGARRSPIGRRLPAPCPLIGCCPGTLFPGPLPRPFAPPLAAAITPPPLT